MSGFHASQKNQMEVACPFTNDPQESHSVTASAVTNWPRFEGRVYVNRKVSSCKKSVGIRDIDT